MTNNSCLDIPETVQDLFQTVTVLDVTSSSSSFNIKLSKRNFYKKIVKMIIVNINMTIYQLLKSTQN